MSSESPRRWRDWWQVLAVIVVAMGVAHGLQARREAVDEELASALRAVAQPGDLRMLGSETCRYCWAARQWLEKAQVPYQECLIERDAACAADYQRTGAQGTPTFMVRGQVAQRGFEPEALLKALQAVKPRSS